MYIVSTTHWAISMALLVRAAKNGSAVGIAMTPIEVLANSYLPAISSVLSDAIVVWRAWILWERRCDLLIPPILFLTGTVGGSITGAVLFLKRVKSTNGGTWQGAVQPNATGARLSYSVYCLIILTNLWATGLICIKAWQHRRFLRSLMERAPREPEQRRHLRS
ncbi:hypothetical protein BC834DRAFT_967503 [Gloeopeniophorella convolvens]|nr:hypothetical protein BC834DRAFT_967503 [Gloeopeniophorella convolvens]